MSKRSAPSSRRSGGGARRRGGHRERGPAKQQGAVKLGFITKFPVDFYFTLQAAAKKWDKATPGRDRRVRAGQGATDDAGEIAAIQNMVAQGVKGIAITPTSAAVIRAARQGDQARRQGRADGQRHPDVEEEDRRSSRPTTTRAACSPGKYLATRLKAGDTLGILEGVPGVKSARRPRHRDARGPRRIRSKIKVV